ncbi:MAG: helix-turn-helix domain-containing protein [Egibacteraceae bacterium]
MEPAERYQREREELGSALRRLRRDAGLTGVEAAQRAGMSQSKISKIETAALLPSVDDVDVLCHALSAPAELRADLLDRTERLHTEIDSFRAVQRRGLHCKQEEIGELEAETISFRDFQPLAITGLLQTAAYMRQIFALFISGVELGKAVTARLERQAVLYDSSKRFTFLIPEGALRWRFCSNQAMLAQFDRIASIATLPNVRIGVIPWTASVRELPLQGFGLYDDRLAIVGLETGEVRLRDPKDVAVYLKLFAALEESAVFGDEARAVLARVADDYRRLGEPEPS